VTLEEELADIVGPQHVLIDADLRASYEVDWTGRFRGSCRCVVRPASTEQVVGVVRCCAAAGASITVQGGNTGLVGGAVPSAGDVLIDTRRLNTVGEYNAATQQIRVGAGATLGDVQRALVSLGRRIGVDLAARDTCTIGGMVATNAGGIEVLRHGMMRRQVAGVEVVLADGRVMASMSGLTKDNTGYDIAGLLCGSEGTLGIVTSVLLVTVPIDRDVSTALVAVATWTEAVDLANELRDTLDRVSSLEVMTDSGMALVAQHIGRPIPCQSPLWLLIEGPVDTDRLSECVGDRQALVASHPAQRHDLWQWRERHTEAVSALGVPVKLDVSLPLDHIADFVAAMPKQLVDHEQVIVFGHLGDGNLHVNIIGVLSRPPTEQEEQRAEQLTENVFRLTASLGGSISAEHGVGRAKKHWLHLSRSPEELHAMNAIRQALDPQRLFNPHITFDPPPSLGVA
jgi:FAD/FMN-containing dehydrogenase